MARKLLVVQMRCWYLNSLGWLLVVFALTILCGCSLRRAERPTCCPPYASQRGCLVLSEKQPGLGVQSDFAAISEYRANRGSIIGPIAPSNSMVIDLNEAICAAARNSELAELIEANWHVIKCRSQNNDTTALDSLVHGEALEQRNKAGGSAGKLFLGLVEVNLQRELLEETRQHLDELAETIRVAANEGFATADGENELAAARLQFKSVESKLNSSEQLLISQLNALVNIDSENLIALQPVYELRPADLHLDPQTQVELAETNRPGICALKCASCSCLQPAEILRLLLGQPGTQQGPESASHPLEQRIIHNVLMKHVERQNSIDPAANTQRDQLARMLEIKKNQARTETRAALIKIQSSHDKLAIVNEQITDLNAKAVQLQAKQELDARGTHLEMHKNWSQLQTAKSDRVTTAIDYDKAILELLEAQGLLLTRCGYCNSAVATNQVD